MHVHVTCRVPVVRVARPATHPFDLPGRSGGGRGSKHPFHRSSSLLSTFDPPRKRAREAEGGRERAGWNQECRCPVRKPYA